MSTPTNYWKLFDSCTISTSRVAELDAICNDILAHKADYVAIADAVNSVWYLIAAIHYRESSLNFKCHLHNGDPLTARTTHVPKGRPLTGKPPFSFVESAIDALTIDHLTQITDIRIGILCGLLESFNGMGYQKWGVHTPYVWNFTNQYGSGKYVADGIYSAGTVDQQAGAAAILLRLYQRGEIALLGESAVKVTVAGKVTTDLPNFVLRGNSWIGARALVAKVGGTITSASSSSITIAKGGKQRVFPSQIFGGVGYVDASDAIAFLGRSISYIASTRTLVIS